jgi:ABC-type bacteriocin/lantibiotic exporter with double-glycine peptidase domain
MKTTKQRAASAALAAIGLLGIGAIAGIPRTLDYLRANPEAGKALRARLAGARYLGEQGVVLQQHMSDCGAACLKMVFAARGIERDLAQLELAARTTQTGATLLNLRLAAEQHGVPAKAWSLTPDDLARAPLPAIAFVGGDHYVVVRSFIEDDVLEIDDPAIGKLRWPMKAFRRKWSGETLVFDPAWTPPQPTRS